MIYGEWLDCGFCTGSPLPGPLTGSFRTHEVEPSTYSSRTKDKRSSTFCSWGTTFLWREMHSCGKGAEKSYALCLSMKVRYRETIQGRGRNVVLEREFRRSGDLRAGCCQSKEDSHVVILSKRVPGQRTGYAKLPGRSKEVYGAMEEEGMRMSVWAERWPKALSPKRLVERRMPLWNLSDSYTEKSVYGGGPVP